MGDQQKPIPEETRALAVRVARHVQRLSAVTLLLSMLFLFITAFPEVFQRAFIASGPELVLANSASDTVDEGIVNGIHVESGFIADTNWELVNASCSSCHSAKLVTQNRADSAGWTHMIRWMQETQNLWDLGDNEALIVAYLAKNYPQRKKGRRARLANIEWYDLKP